MIDPFGADLLAHFADEMVGPMADGIRVDRRPLEAGGLARMTAPLREAALFLALKTDLSGEAVAVTAALTQPDARPLPPLSFAAWSSQGSALPLYAPVAGAADVAPFTVQIAARRGETDLDEAALMALFDLRLVSGRMAKLLYVLEAESVALRRHMRAISAARSVETARGTSLDRTGTDLGVPRFFYALRLVAGGTVEVLPERESDDDYRRRLALMRAVNVARPAQLAQRLGRSGPVGALGFDGTLTLVEADNPFNAAVFLFSAGDTPAAAQAQRQNFEQYLTDYLLIDPAEPVPERRRLSAAARAKEEALRTRLRLALDFETAARAMAQDLAEAFDRLTQLARALGVDRPVDVVRAFDPAAPGSRFAFGLGAEVRAFSEAERATLHAAAQGAVPEDREVAATFSALEPPPAPDDDPDGAWFYRAAGFRTVHRLGDDRLYLSHFSVAGLAVTGPKEGQTRTPLDFAARHFPPGEVGADAAVAEAMAQVQAEFAGTVSAADRAAVLAQADPTEGEPALRSRAVGLPVVTDWTRIIGELETLDAAAWDIALLPEALGTQLRDGDDAAWQALDRLGRRLEATGLAAALPFFGVGDTTALILSTVSLPTVGANLVGKSGTRIRWLVVPIDRPAIPGVDGPIYGLSREAGATTTLTARREGLFAVIAVGYERRGDTDPFEVRIEADEADQLSFAQYEMLMNVLGLRAPAGVEINTWPIRRRHVVDADGTRTPLSPNAANTFRPFFRPRRARATTSE